MTTGTRPLLTVRAAAGTTRAVLLVLPGGKADSLAPCSPGRPAALRMLPFARRVHRAGRGIGLAVWTLHYRCQGWNGELASPLRNVSWALSEVRRRHGRVPVVLLGHSLGGRAALRMAGDPSVRAVLALAPWLPAGEPASQLAGRRVLIAHGTLDRVTSPRASRAYAGQAAATTQAGWVPVRGDTHAMLLRPGTWHRLAVRFVLGALAPADVPAVR